MSTSTLAEIYRGYIDCLNKQDWPSLGRFVDDNVSYNGQRVGLSGYRDMLVRDFEAIPGLSFTIDFIVADGPRLGSRLLFDCTPKGQLFGFPVNGRRVAFTENVFYEFAEGRIIAVWSVIDKAAIEAQL
ncbi:ester cyclase [Rhizobium sp. S152]|uniref:ester cyclase n=1 Tax=Rhizobium sp. S152 TaxID=3055038 RepID=UPI0025A995A1|nr:ester cyclase [Rhizobium sp. S152]MDM9627350.1 ester cyclase [Rhizobium sp. S152]